MIQIDTSDSIIIDGRDTGLKLTQRAEGTVIYTPERPGQSYVEHPMPYARYSAACDAPKKPGRSHDPNVTAGYRQLAVDVLALKEAIEYKQFAGFMKSLGDKVHELWGQSASRHG